MPVPDKLSVYNMRSSDACISDQYTKIWGTDWKYLIILDACRYDYFERVYREFLQGRLEKVRSCGSTTAEWLKCTFGGRKCSDTVYISANPYINSKGITYRGFNPRNYLSFYKIIDVWDWGWSNELETVHPKEINKAVLIAKKLYPDKKIIIHYIQPHYPYLNLVTQGLKVNKLKIEKEVGPVPIHPLERIKYKIRGFIRWKIAYRLKGEKGIEFMNKLIGNPPPSYVEIIARMIGIEGLRQAYEANLRIVLSYVTKLIKHLHGKIVITADHGEFLGERGMYEHPPGKRFPELIEVPWLELYV